jgi:hypothetical protein
MKKEDIEILNYEKFSKDNSKIIGFVDIRIPKLCDLEIYHIAHMQNASKRWFNWPTFKKDSLDGILYHPYAKFKCSAHNDEILALLSEPVKQFCERNGIFITQQPKPIEFPNDDELPF